MRCWHPETYLRLRWVEESKVDLRLKNSINSVNSIRNSFATTEARTNQNTDPESQFPAEHSKTTNKSPQAMVLEISRLFRLKSWVPKWPCHSTYIFIAKYQGNVREKVERVEEEWGKVARAEEELSGTYLKETTCMSLKTMSYVRRSSRTFVRKRSKDARPRRKS